jgi:aspartate/methionine/tyrosine aminotransferase
MSSRDEIYSELTYGKKHFSIAALPGMKERTIYISGFSKAFAMTGWRLGYICAPKDAIAHIRKIHQYGSLAAPTISQYAALEALHSGQEETEKMKMAYDERRRYLIKALKEMALDCFAPEGAFYVFPCIKEDRACRAMSSSISSSKKKNCSLSPGRPSARWAKAMSGFPTPILSRRSKKEWRG